MRVLPRDRQENRASAMQSPSLAPYLELAHWEGLGGKDRTSPGLPLPPASQSTEFGLWRLAFVDGDSAVWVAANRHQPNRALLSYQRPRTRFRNRDGLDLLLHRRQIIAPGAGKPLGDRCIAKVQFYPPRRSPIFDRRSL